MASQSYNGSPLSEDVLPVYYYIFRRIKYSPALSPIVTMIMRKGKRNAPLNRLYFIKLSMNIPSKSYARETDPKDREVRHEQML